MTNEALTGESFSVKMLVFLPLPVIPPVEPPDTQEPPESETHHQTLLQPRRHCLRLMPGHGAALRRVGGTGEPGGKLNKSCGSSYSLTDSARLPCCDSTPSATLVGLLICGAFKIFRGCPRKPNWNLL